MALKITPEIQAEINRLEALTAAEIDDFAITIALRKGAEEQAEILRLSKQYGDRIRFR